MSSNHDLLAPHLMPSHNGACFEHCGPNSFQAARSGWVKVCSLWTISVREQDVVVDEQRCSAMPSRRVGACDAALPHWPASGELSFFITSAAHFGDVGLAFRHRPRPRVVLPGPRWVHDKAIGHVHDWVSSGHITTDAGDALA